MSGSPIFLSQQGAVGIVTLNHPETRNAMSEALMQAILQAFQDFEHNSTVSVVLLEGSTRDDGTSFFSAGADLHELSLQNYPQVYQENALKIWDAVATFRKPLMASVCGYALGGGLELALMCDIIVAADTATFGQPEITVGTIPGGGATQRLPRLIGRSKAMDLCLTGRRITALEAESWGLISRVVPEKDLDQEVRSLAQQVATFSLPVLMMIKEAIQQAWETPFQHGVRFERRLFEAACALNDRQEGMKAFLEKRPPTFTDQ